MCWLSGGLGPTEDDLTREAAAGALGLELRRDPAILAGLYKRFAARQIVMPPNNAKQADVIAGATVLDNVVGSAPGQYIDTTIFYADRASVRRIVVLLPGPPRELKSLFTEAVRPMLAAGLPPNYLVRRLLRMALIPESQVDARTAPIYKEYADVETTILAGSAEIQLHFAAVKATLEVAQARVDEVAERVEAEMEDAVFSSNGDSLEEVVLLNLGMRNLTLAAAESCTGGMLAERLTAVSRGRRGIFWVGRWCMRIEAEEAVFADVLLVETCGDALME